MKRDEKNAQSRLRILEAAMSEFAARGYDTASLNTVCSENNISKGIIYHHFKDKDELYICCTSKCFDALTVYMTQAREQLSGTPEQVLRKYFDARLSFFTEHQIYLALFITAVIKPPSHLIGEIARVRKQFDELNISILTKLLQSSPIRLGLTVEEVVEDLRIYMDYFNLHLQNTLGESDSPQQAIKRHEERCHRQINMLLYGVMGEGNEREN